MLVNLRHVVAAFMLAAGALPSACLAQAEEAARAVDPKPQPQSGLLIDLEFRGGTAVDFINAIRKAGRDRINIVAMPHVEEILVPPMTLRGVDVGAAVSLLDGERLETAGRAVLIKVRPVFGQTITPDALPLIKVIAEVKEAGIFNRSERSNIWSVADLIAGDMSPEHITTAVSAALELLGPDTSKAQVRFHKETALLLARADVEQIQIIESVIDQLRRSNAHRREQSMAPMKQEMLTLQHQFEDIQRAREAMEREAMERLRAAESAKARAEAMERRSVEMEDAVARLRDELMQRESIIRALEEEVGKLRGQVKRNPDRE